MNPLVAATQRRHEVEYNAITRDNASALAVDAQGLWLRQGDKSGQTVIRAARADLDGTELADVSFFGLGPDGAPTVRINADSATLLPGAWQLTNAKIWDMNDPANPEAQAQNLASFRLESNLTRDQIRDSFGTPSAISFWDLPGFVQQLENAGFSARTHRMWYQSQLALPISMIAMVMIAAVFTLRHTRMGRTGLMILLATLSGFTLSFIQNLTTIMAENGQIPIELAAWGPAVAGILLSFGVLLHLEDG